MQVRRLRKVHQHSMFPIRWTANFEMEFGTTGQGHSYAVPDAKIILPSLAIFRVVRAKDGVEVAVYDSIDEANELIEKHVRQKKAKLIVA